MCRLCRTNGSFAVCFVCLAPLCIDHAQLCSHCCAYVCGRHAAASGDGAALLTCSVPGCLQSMCDTCLTEQHVPVVERKDWRCAQHAVPSRPKRATSLEAKEKIRVHARKRLRSEG